MIVQQFVVRHMEIWLGKKVAPTHVEKVLVSICLLEGIEDLDDAMPGVLLPHEILQGF